MRFLEPLGRILTLIKVYLDICQQEHDILFSASRLFLSSNLFSMEFSESVHESIEPHFRPGPRSLCAKAFHRRADIFFYLAAISTARPLDPRLLVQVEKVSSCLAYSSIQGYFTDYEYSLDSNRVRVSPCMHACSKSLCETTELRDCVFNPAHNCALHKFVCLSLKNFSNNTRK